MSCEASTVVLCAVVCRRVCIVFCLYRQTHLVFCIVMLRPRDEHCVENSSPSLRSLCLQVQLRAPLLISFECFRSLKTVTERYAPRSRYRIPSVKVNDYTRYYSQMLHSLDKCQGLQSA